MDIEDFKHIWKSNSGFQFKNESELILMLRGKSNSVISKIKRNVWLELGFSFGASVLLLIYALTLPSGALKWTAVSITILFLVYSIYYVKKLLLLNRFNVIDNDLRTSLSALIANLTSYIKFYRASYAILYPVYLILGLLFGYIESGRELFFVIMSKTSVLLYLGILTLVFFFVSTWFTRWYLHKLYGSHIEKLKLVLGDLREDTKSDVTEGYKEG